MLERNAYLVPTLNAPYQIIRGGVKRGVPRYAVEKSKSVMKSHFQSVRRAYKSRIPIAMGTDAGTPFNCHGDNLKEMELLIKTGFTSMEAIIATTKTASELLGLEKSIGTLEKGKLADLIVVDGDPLDDIRLLQKKDKILAILKEGFSYKCQL
jgi:imidazolonepropionase-like amidohydrolase